DDDDGGLLQFRIDVPLESGLAYILVVTTHWESITGTYSISAVGPGIARDRSKTTLERVMEGVLSSLSSFVNGDFETGNCTGWTIGGGSRNNVISSQLKPEDYLSNGSPCNSSITSSRSQIVTSGNDSNLPNEMLNIVHSGNYAWRVEDYTTGGYVSVISQQMNNYFCRNISFAWLAVLENGDHTPDQSAAVIIELKDLTANATALSRVYNANRDDGGRDDRFNNSGNYFFTPSWQIENLLIANNSIGHNFTLTVLAADCSPTGHRGYVYLDSFGCVAP
ncbi:unnamed protein product, partial [Rotaria socialis]